MVGFDLTDGEEADAAYSSRLHDIRPPTSIGDKGYTSKVDGAAARARGIEQVIGVVKTLLARRPAVRENGPQPSIHRQPRSGTIFDQFRANMQKGGTASGAAQHNFSIQFRSQAKRIDPKTADYTISRQRRRKQPSDRNAGGRA
jgi:hypothetical protein